MIEERAGQPVVIGDVVIEPIERVTVHVEAMGRAIAGIGHKEPVAVVVRSPAGVWRIDLGSDGSAPIEEQV